MDNTANDESSSSNNLSDLRLKIGYGPTFRLILLTTVFLTLTGIVLGSYGSGIVRRYIPLFRRDLPIEEIKIGIEGKFTGVFPNSQAEFFDNMFNAHIFEGLTKIANGKIVPALAVSWSNPNDQTWHFILRRNVKFSNGEQFTAADFKFSFDQALKNNWPSNVALSTVEEVNIIDDFTVEIKTKTADPILFNKLSAVFIISQKDYQKDKQAIGTGPYTLVELTKEKAILVVNPNYYLNLPKAKRAIFAFYPKDSDSKIRIKALLQGQLDLISNLRSAEDKKKLEAKGFLTKSITDPFIIYLSFDMSRDKSPYVYVTPNPFTKKSVRQAVYQAINVGEIIEEASLSAKAATQYVTAQIFGYNPKISRPGYDPIKASELIKSAGYDKGFKLELDVPGHLKDIADIIASQLAVAKIEVEVNPLPKIGGFEKLDRGDTSFFILAFGAETGDGGEVLTDVLHTKAGKFGIYNNVGYSNSELDQLAEQASTTLDQRQRLKLLQQAFKIAADDIVWVPLYSEEQIYAYSQNLEFTPSPFGQIFANEISRIGFSFE